MHNEKFTTTDSQVASLGHNQTEQESFGIAGTYHVTCLDKDGNVKWEDTVKNIVCTAGRNHLLDTYLGGSGYTATWYLGLWLGTAPIAADTMASHGFTESVPYSQATRPAATFASSGASAGAKTASAASVFSCNATATLKGCFLASNSTKSGGTGTLFSAGAFTQGDKGVNDTDTLNVTYTCSTTSS